MRGLVLVALLAACGHSKASGPKWPEPSTTADDGGESLEPRPSSTYAAAIEKSADADEAKPAAATTSTTTTPTADDKPATTPATTTAPSDDVFMSEEIIIEIDD